VGDISRLGSGVSLEIRFPGVYPGLFCQEWGSYWKGWTCGGAVLKSGEDADIAGDAGEDCSKWGARSLSSIA
jgi:hypothetical protein